MEPTKGGMKTDETPDKEPDKVLEKTPDKVLEKTPDMVLEKTPDNDEVKHLEQKKELCEVEVDISGNMDAVQLKAPIVVYREIYKKAKEKAKMARRLAIQAFLEAKKIKNTFLVGEVEESDDDDLDSLIDLPNE